MSPLSGTWNILLMLLLIIPNYSFAQQKQLPEQEGTQWYPFLEWEITNVSFEGNPFDVEGQAVFKHVQTEQSVKTPLFYDGENTWKFRFTGIETGEWHIDTFSKNKSLNGWRGKVVITKNPDRQAHGFIKSFGSKWGWQGTEQAFVPQYVMGKELQYYYDFSAGNPDEGKIEADITEFMDEHSFTGFHLKIAQSWFDIENKGPFVNPDIRTYQVLETILRKVHQAGGACHLWLWGSDGGRNNNDGDGPRGILGESMNDKDRRNLRYIAARLGLLPGWSMGYGIDTENGVATKKQLDEWKAYLEQQLGWDHFLGARVGYDEKGLWALSPRPPRPPHDEHYRSAIKDEYTFWLGGDYIGYTSYRPLYDRYVEVLNHHPEKPSFEEDRFRLRDSETWSYKDYNEELTRRGLWHSALAGGVANIWGNLLPEEDHGGSRPYKIKTQIKTYSRFFENRFLKEMQTEKTGEVLSLKTPDHNQLIFYQENTEQVAMNLGKVPSKMPAVAVDTKKDYKEINIGPLSPKDQVWKAPYKSDWAIAVGEY